MHAVVRLLARRVCRVRACVRRRLPARNACLISHIAHRTSHVAHRKWAPTWRTNRKCSNEKAKRSALIKRRNYAFSEHVRVHSAGARALPLLRRPPSLLWPASQPASPFPTANSPVGPRVCSARAPTCPPFIASAALSIPPVFRPPRPRRCLGQLFPAAPLRPRLSGNHQQQAVHLLLHSRAHRCACPSILCRYNQKPYLRAEHSPWQMSRSRSEQMVHCIPQRRLPTIPHPNPPRVPLLLVWSARREELGRAKRRRRVPRHRLLAVCRDARRCLVVLREIQRLSLPPRRCARRSSVKL